MEPVLIICVVAMLIGIAIWAVIQERKRREALALWVAAHDLRFDPDRNHSFDEQFPEFDCLRSGSNRYAYNIITGQWRDRTLLAFDYHYETYSTNSKGHRQTHHHHFSAVMLHANVPLKPLIIRSENLFDKMAGAFGFDDIDFESAQFSKRFYVKAPDRRWAYDVIHPRAMQLLLDSPKFSIEFDRQYVMAWRSGRFKITDYEAALTLIEGLLNQLPDYLCQKQEEAAS
jgi:hypothetical protein